MNIYLLNDTSLYHSGSAAAVNEIRRILKAQGHTITGMSRGCGNRHIQDQNALVQADAILVNGEGTMHHNSGYAYWLLDQLEEAQKAGQKTYLINTLWQEMTKVKKESVLKKLDALVVRELRSYQDLRKRGLDPTICPDVSFTHPIDWDEGIDFEESIVMGDFLFKELEPLRSEYPRLTMKDGTWEYIVASLKTASLYITGRHHGIYAACLAKTPFVPFRTNSHKIEGLFAWANVNIPILESHEGLEDAMYWTMENLDVFEKLFTFLEEASKWEGIPPESV